MPDRAVVAETTEERSGSCVVCMRRDARFPQVCDADRSKLSAWLGELPGLVADMVAPELVERDIRPWTYKGTPVDRWPADPIAHHLRAAPVPGQRAGSRITGSGERPLPIPVTPLDLSAPDRVANTTALYREQPDDQVGELSVATVLDTWVRDWRERRHKGEALPPPVVADLTSWLQNRTEWACDEHPAVDEFFADVAHLRSILRAILGLREAPDYKKGIPCRRCDSVALFRLNGSDWIECGNCPDLMSPEEYERWTGLLAAELKAHRNSEDQPEVDIAS